MGPVAPRPSLPLEQSTGSRRLKVATNTTMFNRMSGDMDLNAGTIADAQDTVAELGARLFELFIQTASGRQTSSELLGFGDDDFVPWQTGIVT